MSACPCPICEPPRKKLLLPRPHCLRWIDGRSTECGIGEVGMKAFAENGRHVTCAECRRRRANRLALAALPPSRPPRIWEEGTPTLIEAYRRPV